MLCYAFNLLMAFDRLLLKGLFIYLLTYITTAFCIVLSMNTGQTTSAMSANILVIKVKKGKGSGFIVVPHTQGAQVRITQCYLQITPYL